MTTPKIPSPSNTDGSRLKIYVHPNSHHGLCSLTTLIVGDSSAVLIDAPFLIADAKHIVSWIKSITDNPISAIFVSHHHPDHYWSADTILDAYPSAKFYAAPYICKDISLEYDTKVSFVKKLLGTEASPEPLKPDPYPWGFFLLNGNPTSPIILLGPLQGDCINHTIFWLPVEQTVICGDVIYGRNTHVWCEEIESPEILQAWENTLALIESLRPVKIVVGHLAADLSLDIVADLTHTREYLSFFKKTILDHPGKMSKEEIIITFRNAYPQCEQNSANFFLTTLGNRFGNEDLLKQAKGPRSDPLTELLHHNRIHKAGSKTSLELEGFIL